MALQDGRTEATVCQEVQPPTGWPASRTLSLGFTWMNTVASCEVCALKEAGFDCVRLKDLQDGVAFEVGAPAE